MNSVLYRIFINNPVWAQNIAISLYGAILWNRRYRGSHDRYLAKLNEVNLTSKKIIRALQWESFIDLLGHAFSRVPYYKKYAKDQGVTVGDFKSFADLRQLPIIEKEELRADPRYFCDTLALQRNPLVFHTSGTTGKALTIYCDKDSRRHHYAFWTRLRQWHGIGKRDKRATLFGRIICDPDSNLPPFWRFDRVGNNLLMSSYHLSGNNLPHYVLKLQEFCPAELIGYASSIFLLAKHLVREGVTTIRPKIVFATADTLFEHQRRVIEEAFSCPVIDQYGCAEMAVFAADDGRGDYLVHPEHGLLEVLDANDRPVPGGGTGQAVCTGFINRTMPLIRYRIGDQISTTLDTPDSDGLVARFSGIVGRVDDVLISPDGRPLGRFSPIWKVVPGVMETQVIQKTINSLDINLVVDHGFQNRKDGLPLLEMEIRKRTGSEMKIRFHFLDEIPKNHNGKFRTVISEVNKNGR